MRFRKKPVAIEAFMVGMDQEPEWMMGRCDFTRQIDEHSTTYLIETLEGTMNARVGDWIIKGVNNEIYPCKPDIFEKTYERVDS